MINIPHTITAIKVECMHKSFWGQSILKHPLTLRLLDKELLLSIIYARTLTN